MKNIQDLLSALWFETLDLDRGDNWWQLGVILVALLIGYFVAKRLTTYLTAHASPGADKSLRRLTIRTIQRLLFPISTMLLILLGRAILHALKLPAHFLGIAVTLLISLASIRMIIYMLRKAFSPSPLLKAWESLVSTTIWLVVALYLVDWLPVVTKNLDSIGFRLGQNHITLLSIINFIILVAVFFTLAVWTSNHIERRMLASRTLDASLKVALVKLVKVVLITFALLVALDTAGIDLTALSVFGGALGVGLGFGLQRVTSNFISGFILIFDKSIKPGDVISIGNKFGWVEELHARYIVVRDRDGVNTLIPNENLVTTDRKSVV